MTTPTTRQSLATLLREGDTLRYGWHLIGAGSARHGWAAYTAAGAGRYLGRCAAEARARADVGPYAYAAEYLADGVIDGPDDIDD